MLKEAIYHITDMPYAFPVSSDQLKVRIRAGKNDIAECYIFYADRYDLPLGNEDSVLMHKTASDLLFDYFEIVITIQTKRPRYKFYLKDKEGSGIWYGEEGFCTDVKNPDVYNYFQFPYICEADIFRIPEWAKDAIAYQIYPQSFHNGDAGNDPQNVARWGELPGRDTFYGGDLKGITEKLPYLSDLGINTIYMTPVFKSSSPHKYDTEDYLCIDPSFGDIDVLKELVNECHKRGIHVILDAVFAFCGYDFFAFQDVVKNGAKSKYADWFNVYSYPIVKSPASFETFAYNVWQLPKIYKKNPQAKDYFLKVSTFWIEEAGIDGWRLDTANEEEHGFWREFRKVVKNANHEALIIGEVWHSAEPWLRGDEFDSVLNYRLQRAVKDFFAKRSINVEIFDARLTEIRMRYPEQATHAAFNLLDSHDTERFLTTCGGNIEQMMLAVVFQMTYIGIPMIYYGDEVGMEGWEDPDCRRSMIWDEEKQNKDMLRMYKKLIKIRRKHSAIARGEFYTWVVDPLTNAYGYLRKSKDDIAAVLINNSTREHIIEANADWLPENVTSIHDQLNGKAYPVKDKKLSIPMPPYGAVILALKPVSI